MDVLNAQALASILERSVGPASSPRFDLRPVRRGLSADTVRIRARYETAGGRRGVFAWYAKRLRGPAAREAQVYGQFARDPRLASWAPALLEVVKLADEDVVLHLAEVPAIRRWPWGDVDHAQAVLARAAELHLLAAEGRFRPPAAWDYGAELRAAAWDTAEQAARLARASPAVRAGVPALRRLAASLDGIRRELLDRSDLPATTIHGDLHPGNVVVRRTRGGTEPVLLDWGRLRTGSPLEDVSSWLQSLGCWEPEAARRHDTLLRAYLERRGRPGFPASNLRDAYWIAGASNALAGALRHHLEVLASAPDRRAGTESLRAARSWLRVVRRADAACRA